MPKQLSPSDQRDARKAKAAARQLVGKEKEYSHNGTRVDIGDSLSHLELRKHNVRAVNATQLAGVQPLSTQGSIDGFFKVTPQTASQLAQEKRSNGYLKGMAMRKKNLALQKAQGTQKTLYGSEAVCAIIRTAEKKKFPAFTRGRHKKLIQ